MTPAEPSSANPGPTGALPAACLQSGSSERSGTRSEPSVSSCQQRATHRTCRASSEEMVGSGWGCGQESTKEQRNGDGVSAHRTALEDLGLVRRRRQQVRCGPASRAAHLRGPGCPPPPCALPIPPCSSAAGRHHLALPGTVVCPGVGRLPSVPRGQGQGLQCRSVASRGQMPLHPEKGQGHLQSRQVWTAVEMVQQCGPADGLGQQ